MKKLLWAIFKLNTCDLPALPKPVGEGGCLVACILISVAFSGFAYAGFNIGMTGAFKKQVARLDKEVQIYLKADVAIYRGDGTWNDGIVSFEKFLDSQGITWKEVNSSIINNKDLRSFYKAIYMPGGWAYPYTLAINSSGNQHIRDLVSSGGGYIGICAGAYYAADKINWQGIDYDYPLKLFKGISYGEIKTIIDWPGYKMTGITINLANTINAGQPGSYTMLYYGGPFFVPDGSQQVETLGTYQSNNEKAAINFEYGAGRVLLIGPHPEVEENSDRDGTTFGSGLNDVETDWPFLAAGVRWVLKLSP